jgi:hypothetical protein
MTTAQQLIDGLQESLARRGVDFEAVIESFGQVRASIERAAGRVFTVPDHIRGLVLAQLSNQRAWKPIADNRNRLAELFCDYDPALLLCAEPNELVDGLRRLKCGNRADKKQMNSLAANIRTLARIDVELGGLDSFVSRHRPDRVAQTLSTTGPHKLLYVGPALALEYLKNVGIRASKPDVHVRRSLSGDRLAFASGLPNEWEAYEIVERIAAESGHNAIYVDKLFWMFCAKDYGAICGAQPKCHLCALRSGCSFPTQFPERVPLLG